MNLSEKYQKTLKISLCLAHGYHPFKTMSEMVLSFFICLSHLRTQNTCFLKIMLKIMTNLLLNTVISFSTLAF